MMDAEEPEENLIIESEKKASRVNDQIPVPNPEVTSTNQGRGNFIIKFINNFFFRFNFISDFEKD